MTQLSIDANALVPFAGALGDNRGLRKDMCAAMDKGVSRFEEEARALAPRATGLLSRSVYSTSAEATSEGAEAEVGIDAAKAPYGEFVVGGTRAHTVSPVKAKALRFSGPGGAVFVKEAHIPARAPDDFFTRAWNREQAVIVQDMEDVLAQELEERLS